MYISTLSYQISFISPIFRVRDSLHSPWVGRKTNNSKCFSLHRSSKCNFRVLAQKYSAQLSLQNATIFDPHSRESISHLQNGSDVRGVASESDESQPVTLTPAIVYGISFAFVKRLSLQLDKPIRLSLGRDSRISGPLLLKAAAAGARRAGADVTSFELCTTPAMFMSTVLSGHEYTCAIMLTASHLPPNRNGMKFFTRAGSANKQDIKEILNMASTFIDEEEINNLNEEICNLDPIKETDFLSVYAKHLVQLIRKGCALGSNYEQPLKGFRIVVDAGNGAAGFFANQVLLPLGADVHGQFLEPDGMFPNHVPNPEDSTAMSMTIQKVRETNSDLGIIFDTDVDRAGFVDDKGMAINRNELIALLSRIVLRNNRGATIVTDSVTSNGLKKFIEQNGGVHFRYRKGYKNVIDKGIELNAPLAIETSGHGAMMENYMLDDGAYLAVKILIELVSNKKIGDLLVDLERPLEAKEFRLGFKDEKDFQSYGKKVVEEFRQFASKVDNWNLEEENYEGYRVSVDEGDGKSGWLLIRQSLHDPLLPLNIESDSENGIASIARTMLDGFLSKYENIDVSKLEQYLST